MNKLYDFKTCRNINVFYGYNCDTHMYRNKQILGGGFGEIKGSNGEEILIKFYPCSISCVDNRRVGEGAATG